MSGVPPLERALAAVAARAGGGALHRELRVTVHFHPDRAHGEASVLATIGRDGRYRTQFETRTSNGGLTAHPGGDRWRWEHIMFDGAYDEAPPSQRPVYGALDHHRAGWGGAPRFGSAYLRLTEAVLDRTTFCFPDSVLEPSRFGTAASCDLIPLADVFATAPRSDSQEANLGGALDAYVEAHVHGEVTLLDDVEAVVLDPSHRGTATEGEAHTLGVPVQWHPGFRVDLATIRAHPDFRGRWVVGVAEAVAQNGGLDARVVGEAARTGRYDPQDLKRVWHHVVRWGVPAADA